MAVNIIHDAPALESFTPLEEHQEQTPGTFFGGKPILHLRTSKAQLILDEDELRASDAFSRLRQTQDQPSHTGAHVNGNSATDTPSSRATIPDIDVWVTSEHFILYSPHTHSGLTIPYPSISLHALQRLVLASDTKVPALYLQLNLTSHDQTDDIETLDFSLVPAAAAPAQQRQHGILASDVLLATAAAEDEDAAATSPAQALYAAVTACADLHPDPRTPGEEGDGEEGAGLGGADMMPGAGLGGADMMPGAGGWITAENMGDFMDEDGNFIGALGGLGPGAGTTRGRAELGEEGMVDDGEGEDEDVGGEGEETKWRRTE
ncbi:MAG: hypothetical protein M1821_005873 [Bathelium mastoideum]|nr:MAG: hypothetical protein M1821_005873 [Bathelium mastoideum]